MNLICRFSFMIYHIRPVTYVLIFYILKENIKKSLTSFVTTALVYKNHELVYLLMNKTQKNDLLYTFK
jgi:hypothetical protein